MRTAGGRCLHPLLSCLCWRATSNGILGRPVPQEHPLVTQTLEQDLPHVVSAADMGEATFSFGGVVVGPKLQWSWGALETCLHPPMGHPEGLCAAPPNLSGFLHQQQGERPPTCPASPQGGCCGPRGGAPQNGVLGQPQVMAVGEEEIRKGTRALAVTLGCTLVLTHGEKETESS